MTRTPSLRTPTLQQVIDHLGTLAQETGAELMTTIDLHCTGGALLVVAWTAASPDAIPLEAHLYFPPSSGRFTWGFVYCGKRWVWAVKEGLSNAQADDEARRMVDGFTDVCLYLTGQPYRVVAQAPAHPAGGD